MLPNFVFVVLDISSDDDDLSQRAGFDDQGELVDLPNVDDGVGVGASAPETDGVSRFHHIDVCISDLKEPDAGAVCPVDDPAQSEFGQGIGRLWSEPEAPGVGYRPPSECEGVALGLKALGASLGRDEFEVLDVGAYLRRRRLRWRSGLLRRPGTGEQSARANKHEPIESR